MMNHQLNLGINVGKTHYHITGLSPEGTVVHNKPLPQSEPKIRTLIQNLATPTQLCWYSWIAPRPSARW